MDPIFSNLTELDDVNCVGDVELFSSLDKNPEALLNESQINPCFQQEVDDFLRTFVIDDNLKQKDDNLSSENSSRDKDLFTENTKLKMVIKKLKQRIIKQERELATYESRLAEKWKSLDCCEKELKTTKEKLQINEDENVNLKDQIGQIEGLVYQLEQWKSQQIVASTVENLNKLENEIIFKDKKIKRLERKISRYSHLKQNESESLTEKDEHIKTIWKLISVGNNAEKEGITVEEINKLKEDYENWFPSQFSLYIGKKKDAMKILEDIPFDLFKESSTLEDPIDGPNSTVSLLSPEYKVSSSDDSPSKSTQPIESRAEITTCNKTLKYSQYVPSYPCSPDSLSNQDDLYTNSSTTAVMDPKICHDILPDNTSSSNLHSTLYDQNKDESTCDKIQEPVGFVVDNITQPCIDMKERIEQNSLDVNNLTVMMKSEEDTSYAITDSILPEVIQKSLDQMPPENTKNITEVNATLVTEPKESLEQTSAIEHPKESHEQRSAIEHTETFTKNPESIEQICSVIYNAIPVKEEVLLEQCAVDSIEFPVKKKELSNQRCTLENVKSDTETHGSLETTISTDFGNSDLLSEVCELEGGECNHVPDFDRRPLPAQSPEHTLDGNINIPTEIQSSFGEIFPLETAKEQICILETVKDTTKTQSFIEKRSSDIGNVKPSPGIVVCQPQEVSKAENSEDDVLVSLNKTDCAQTNSQEVTSFKNASSTILEDLALFDDSMDLPDYVTSEDLKKFRSNFYIPKCISPLPPTPTPKKKSNKRKKAFIENDAELIQSTLKESSVKLITKLEFPASSNYSSIDQNNVNSGEISHGAHLMNCSTILEDSELVEENDSQIEGILIQQNFDSTSSFENVQMPDSENFPSNKRQRKIHSEDITNSAPVRVRGRTFLSRGILGKRKTQTEVIEVKEHTGPVKDLAGDQVLGTESVIMENKSEIQLNYAGMCKPKKLRIQHNKNVITLPASNSIHTKVDRTELETSIIGSTDNQIKNKKKNCLSLENKVQKENSITTSSIGVQKKLSEFNSSSGILPSKQNESKQARTDASLFTNEKKFQCEVKSRTCFEDLISSFRVQPRNNNKSNSDSSVIVNDLHVRENSLALTSEIGQKSRGELFCKGNTIDGGHVANDVELGQNIKQNSLVSIKKIIENTDDYSMSASQQQLISSKTSNNIEYNPKVKKQNTNYVHANNFLKHSDYKTNSKYTRTTSNNKILAKDVKKCDSAAQNIELSDHGTKKKRYNIRTKKSHKKKIELNNSLCRASENGLEIVLKNFFIKEISHNNFERSLKSLVQIFINPYHFPDSSLLLFNFFTYLKNSRKNPLQTFLESEDSSILLPIEENCIVTALFITESKKIPHLDGLLKTTITTLCNLILCKKFHIFGLASLCRVFTEICKRERDSAKPVILCADLLKKKHRFAFFLIASVAGVWKELFQVEENSLIEEKLFHSSVLYGACTRPKPKQFMECNWNQSMYIISKYFTAPPVKDARSAVQILKRFIETKCQSDSWDSQYMTSALTILVAYEDWDWIQVNLLDNYIVPNLTEFGYKTLCRVAFDLYCNLYVDIWFLRHGEFSIDNELSNIFKSPELLQGATYVKECVALALIRLLYLKNKQLPPSLCSWFEINHQRPIVQNIEPILKRRLMAESSNVLLMSEIQ